MTYKFDNFKPFLRQFCDTHLRPAPMPANAYICPFCGSGDPSTQHKHRQSAFHIYDNYTRWQCFSCGQHGDVIDLCAKLAGVTLNEAADMLAREFMDGAAGNDDFFSLPVKKKITTDRPAVRVDDRRFQFFKRCQTRLTDAPAVSYLRKRGISLATAQSCGVGFCAAWRHPTAPAGIPASRRIILPNSCSGYTARDIDTDSGQFSKQKVTPAGLFNTDALRQSARPVFVVEGEIDALSIIEAGGQACALCSVAGVNGLFNYIVKARQAGQQIPRLLLALDNDQAGKDATDKLARLLYVQVKSNFNLALAVTGKFKDANEFLTHDRRAFFDTVATLRG